MIEIKKYKIKDECEEEETMVVEKLLGFDFPITKSAATSFNKYAAEAELIVYNTRKKKRKSDAQRIFEEIIEVAAAKKVAITEG